MCVCVSVGGGERGEGIYFFIVENVRTFSGDVTFIQVFYRLSATVLHTVHIIGI